MKKINTIIVPIINHNNIGQMLTSLWKYTEPNFYVIVIDQTDNDKAYKMYKDLSHLWLTSYRNLGFSKAMNTGIKLVDTKFVTLANDDIYFIDKRWWQGIIDAFASDPKIIAVNPMSPKEQGWGYGLTADNGETWQPPHGFARVPDDYEGIVPLMKPGNPFPVKEDYTQEEYDFLLNAHPTWSKDSACDAIAMWCTVFKKTGLDEIGLLDEKFYPGGGEDYDMNARAYSCAWPVERDECDSDFHRRMVGTARSWVMHKWSKSRKISPDDPIFTRPRWNANEELWPNGFDVWGHSNNPDGSKTPLKRIRTITTDKL